MVGKLRPEGQRGDCGEGKRCNDPQTWSRMSSTRASRRFTTVRSRRNPDLPILLNCYHMPVAWPAPAFPGGNASTSVRAKGLQADSQG